MQESSSKGEGEPSVPAGVDVIEELARRLHEAEHLEPQARGEVAALLRELAAELDQPDPPPHAQHLVESTAQLVHAVKDRHEPGLIEASRERLEEAVVRAEAKAPVATGIVLRLIDVLAATGI